MTVTSNKSFLTNANSEENIVFIDRQVSDYQSLVAGIKPQTKVVILDPEEDGIEEMTKYLQGGIYKSVHVVSHGSAGSLQLGSSQLKSGNLHTYKSQLQEWSNYLTEDADILLYGCDVAEGEIGVSFVQQLSQLTGADVAASDDLTGSAALGGDWDLEVKTGKIEANLAFQASVLESYNSILPSAPTLSLPALALPYNENAGFVEIDNTIAVTDSDSTNFNGGKLIVDFTSGANTNDILLIRNNPTAGFIAGVDIPGLNQIRIGATQIGTFTGGMNGRPLEVTFNANATAAAVQTLISNIFYSNISDNPLAGDRTVRFKLTDDTGLTSTPVIKTISLTAVNDAPVIAILGASFDLYNGTGTPNSQGFIYQTLPYLPTGTIQSGNQLNTSAFITDYVGYAAKAELMPILDRNTGYSIKFSAQIISENHSSPGADKNGDGKADRAGFSVTVIGNDKKGIELGFWTNEIWAQNDGDAEPTPTNLTKTLFTHGEGQSFNTTVQTNYELKIVGNAYSLFTNNNQSAILTGNLRDYTSFETPAYLPSNPYQTPNFLFFGDGTPTSSANFQLGAISITTGSNLGSISAYEDTDIAVQGVSINDVDAASISATLKVNNGKLTVNTSVLGGVTLVNGNSTGEVILTGTVNQINTTLAGTTGLVYRGNQDFNGSDTLTVTASDGVTLVSPKTVSINVNSLNDRPTFIKGSNQSVRAGMAQTIAGWASGFNSGAANEKTQDVAGYLVEIVNSVNADIFQVAPTINLAGELSYTAKSGITASKTATIEVKVRDDGGTANGGVDTSVAQTFTITVNPTITNSMNGTPSADINLMGTDQSDRVSALDGDDSVFGGLGSDRIFGGNGNDTLYGDLGVNLDNSDIIPAYGLTFSMDDTIGGGAGNDKIYGNLGNDKLYGDDGNDEIWGGNGDDEIWGNLGNDTLWGGAGRDAFVLVRGQGVDIIEDFKSEDVLGCAGALRYSSLEFTQQGSDTLITDKATTQLLATLKNFTGTPNNGGLF